MKFTGQELDQETGLYNYNARMYDAKLSRFLSPDPAFDGLNLYTYVSNNPVRLIDPTGMTEEDGEYTSYVDMVASGRSGTGNAGGDGGTRCNPDTGHVGSSGGYYGKTNEGYFSNSTAYYDYNFGSKAGQPVNSAIQMLDNATEMFAYGYQVVHEATTPDWILEKEANGEYDNLNIGMPPDLGLKGGAVSKIGRTASSSKYSYRYVSEGEASIIRKTRTIPNTNAKGDLKDVYTSPNFYRTTTEAEDALQIGAKNPFGPTVAPQYRVVFDSRSVIYNITQKVEGGTGIERITNQPIPVLRIYKLKEQ